MGKSRAIWQQAKAAVKSKTWEHELKLQDTFGICLDEVEKMLDQVSAIAKTLDERVTRISHLSDKIHSTSEDYAKAITRAPTIMPSPITFGEAASLAKALEAAAQRAEADWVDAADLLDKPGSSLQSGSVRLLVD